MEKKLFLPAVICITVCLTVCKKEPDLPADPHVPLFNPFIGVWKTGGEYWQFRTDGTGGRAVTEAGPFPDNFCFFIYAGQDVQSAPSRGTLVLLEDSGGVDVIRYGFSIEHITMMGTTMIHATLTPQPSGTSVTLHRESGAPSALNLTNPLVGEWSARWTGSHGNNNTWSFKYRSDGTVKAYHHGSHQFENAYALRHNILVVFGILRFGTEPVIAGIQELENGKWQLSETQLNPPPSEWVYTKVASAEWL
jgi:hypothetical protein